MWFDSTLGDQPLTSSGFDSRWGYQGTITEVKGFKTEQWLAKLEANPDVKVLYEKDLEPVLEYVKIKYGKDFISLYE